MSTNPVNTMTASRRRMMAATLAAATMALLTSCGGSSDTSAASSSAEGAASASTASASTAASASSTSSGEAPTTTTPASGSASGTPSRNPCDLLTKKIAEDALGVAVADAKDVPGQGNETCVYSGADKATLAKVLLTTYSTPGTAAGLDQAAAQFKNAYAVNGVADAARVSIEDHTIGVLDGDFVFGVTLIPPSQGQDIAPVTEAQLVTIANAVLARR
jgi:hypothetical protein